MYNRTKELLKHVAEPLLQAREAVVREGAIPLGLKLGVLAVLSMMKGCETCAKTYVQMAKAQGLTRDELLELAAAFLATAGCLMRTEKLLEAYEEEKGACCG